ncbi:leucine--tRNA ligase [Portibacter lacus]|uniref:Leucine--tRNA ligase n=1 Tax=Portibacter lacus TaxID=1099794 RepID=A0AA37WHW7_9BACT|nr:class I tRNA ligase family protein [Portibacter lacus]GLR20069.1 leucine--tRNA ligase [Portibacter lacus]
MQYNSAEIEAKWKKYWKDQQIYKVDIDTTKPKYYILDMFPYPSGSGLHVGHPLGYIASDIYTRYKRMNGYNVLHPMGYDAFGLPAEQYAIQTGVHPAKSTDENIERYRAQLDNIGFSYDWDRQVKTSDPSYYKWTQWIFLELFNHFYDHSADKARPIFELIEQFRVEGSSTGDITFSAEEWNQMSAKEQDDILMNYRLAYRKTGYVNWCEALGTVLANDEVKDGVSERGGHPVEQRAMMQWSLRITAYAERLLNGLDKVEWSSALTAMQNNWIGRSEGAQVFFDIKGHEGQLEVFTTRPDTIFGATYMVLAPELDIVSTLTTPEQKEEIENYLSYVKSRSDLDRMSESKTVTGAFTGAYAINPFNNEEVPIWIGEYVLKDYGTGAIMAVPSDDDRDKAFATKFGLKIIDVVDKSDYPGATLSDKLGKIINSDFLNGMEVPEAIQFMFNEIEKRGIGAKKINYKLRDANFSRQRYWGEPFPIKFDKENVAHPLSHSELPLELPELEDFKPTSSGKSPLARLSDWTVTEDGMTRETDTMPGYAGSSWYFLRYMDPKNPDAFASKEAVNYWQDVDIYIGGTEHAVGHLMYSRFWHKFLYDLNLVPTEEPFKKLINQGMIQGVIEYVYLSKDKENGQSKFVCAKIVEASGDEDNYAKIPIFVDYVKNYGSPDSFLNVDSIKQFVEWRPEYKDAIFQCGQGEFQFGVNENVDSHLVTKSEIGKMSKRYFNVVNPDDVVAEYGADCFRMYEMFLGPIEQSKPWDTNGIDGVSKFLRKYWALFFNEEGKSLVTDNKADEKELKVLHTVIKKVNEDVERFSFNTAISAFMTAVNDLRKLKCHKKEVLAKLNLLLSPFAPFITEEIHEILGFQGSIHTESYPKHEDKYLVESTINYPVSFNGKKRGEAAFSADATREDIMEEVKALPVFAKYTEGLSVKKIIVVPGRMINVVVG